MKNKTYRYGTTTGKTYFKPVGQGYETGFIWGGKKVFVGNFIHHTEATRWFALMNQEIQRFGRRFTLGRRFPTSWTSRFLGNHLYRTYYGYLDRLFTRYNRTFGKAVVRDLNQFRRKKNSMATTSRKHYLRAA